MFVAHINNQSMVCIHYTFSDLVIYAAKMKSAEPKVVKGSACIGRFSAIVLNACRDPSGFPDLVHSVRYPLGLIICTVSGK